VNLFFFFCFCFLFFFFFSIFLFLGASRNDRTDQGSPRSHFVQEAFSGRSSSDLVALIAQKLDKCSPEVLASLMAVLVSNGQLKHCLSLCR
jgi:hypothetical protein